jgi:hypothetical protein
LVNATQNIREEVIIRRKANGLPFDNGVFDLSTLAFDAPFNDDPLRFTAEKIQWPKQWLAENPHLSAELQAEVERNIATMRTAQSTRALTPTIMPAM